jgi:hypothetical protein
MSDTDASQIKRSRSTKAGVEQRRQDLRKIVDAGRPRGRLVDVIVQHDDWCGIYRGGGCDCTPDVSLHPHGDAGDVTIVDEEGRPKKVAAS